MADLQQVLREAVPPADAPAIEDWWARGQRLRRRRRLVLTGAPLALLAIAAIGIVVADGGRDERVRAGVTTTTTELPPQALAEGHRTFLAPTLRKLTVGGGLDVVVVRGGGAIALAGDEEALDDVMVDVDGDSGRVSITRDSPPTRDDESVSVLVEANDLEELEAGGGVTLQISMNQDVPLIATIGGGVRLDGTLVAPSLELDLSGGVRVELDGDVDTLDLEGSGGVLVELGDLDVGVLRAVLSGGSRATVRVTDTIESVQLSGGSRLDYRGDPRIGATDVDISSRFAPE